MAEEDASPNEPVELHLGDSFDSLFMFFGDRVTTELINQLGIVNTGVALGLDVEGSDNVLALVNHEVLDTCAELNSSLFLLSGSNRGLFLWDLLSRFVSILWLVLGLLHLR